VSAIWLKSFLPGGKGGRAEFHALSSVASSLNVKGERRGRGKKEGKV